MGIDTKIDISRMRDVARVINNQLGIVTSCFESITNESLGLNANECWLGDSSDMYYSIMKKLTLTDGNPDAINAGFIMKAIRGYVTQLNIAADTFATTEGRITNKTEVLPTDIFGV